MKKYKIAKRYRTEVVQKLIGWTGITFIALMCTICLCSCKSINQTVEVPVYIHDTTYMAKEIHDSTYIGRYHTIEMKGDTVFVTNEQITVKLRTITDTAYKYVEKPVTVTVEQIKEVEKPLRWWQKALLWSGGVAIVAVVLFMLAKYWQLLR